jgi:predicted nuclease of restriction endonuclease-like RecB superfamily
LKKKKLKNKFEVKLFKQLKRSRVNFEYEPIRIPYTLSGYYIPDFLIDGSRRILVEAKGYLRPEHKRKMVAVKRQHPELDIRIVFYAKVAKNIRWAEKNGFPYAIGKIPKEWLR